MNVRQQLFGLVGALAIGLASIGTPQAAAAQTPGDEAMQVSKKNKKKEQQREQESYRAIYWTEFGPDGERRERSVEFWVPWWDD